MTFALLSGSNTVLSATDSRVGSAKGFRRASGPVASFDTAAQSRGRSEFYEDYTLFACKNPRIHRFSRKDGP